MIYKAKSPILFMIFNRPQETKKVFEAIKRVKPSRLYISADGARVNKPGDQKLCEAARAVVEDVDWECEVKTRFSEVNLGCRKSVSSAISWFFENEAEGIILEDDCLPDHQFFEFCDILLEKYRNDTRIRHISGSNLNMGQKFDKYSYYFSKLTNVWGWASWARVWKDYDVDMHLLDESICTTLYKNVFNNDLVTKYFWNQLKSTQLGHIDTWDYQYAFSNMINNGLSINPNYNMISNIGFDGNATHTVDSNNRLANMPIEHLIKMVHPTIIIPNTSKDIVQLKMQIPTRVKYKLKIKSLIKGY